MVSDFSANEFSSACTVFKKRTLWLHVFYPKREKRNIKTWKGILTAPIKEIMVYNACKRTFTFIFTHWILTRDKIDFLWRVKPTKMCTITVAVTPLKHKQTEVTVLILIATFSASSSGQIQLHIRLGGRGSLLFWLNLLVIFSAASVRVFCQGQHILPPPTALTGRQNEKTGPPAESNVHI